PLFTNLRFRLLFLFGYFLIALLVPFRFTSGVDLGNWIRQMDGIVIVSAGFEEHLQRLAFRVSMLAITGEDIMIGFDTFEENRLHVPVAAMMRHLKYIDVHVAVLWQQANELQSFHDLVAARIACEQDSFIVGFSQNHNTGKIGD